MAIISFKSVTLSYGRNIVLEDLNFQVLRGDFLGIVGPNGSGKTTVLKAILGLLKPKKGEINVNNDLKFGYCKQRQSLDAIFPFSVEEIVKMIKAVKLPFFKKLNSNELNRIEYALEVTGINKLRNRRFHELSGGEKQRVLIARALALEPDILVLDEPTVDLDVKAQIDIMELIAALHSKGLTVILVAHDLNTILNYVNKLMFLKKGISSSIYNKEEVLKKDFLSSVFGLNIKIVNLDNKNFIHPYIKNDRNN